MEMFTNTSLSSYNPVSMCILDTITLYQYILDSHIYNFPSKYVCIKGHLISKAIFGVIDSPKK